MLTLVTGGTGSIGVPLIEALLKRGDEIRVLARPDSDVDVLPDADIDILDGDITDAEDVQEAVKGCDRIFHLAGLFRDVVEDQREFFDVNVGGTVNVLQAALDQNVEKVVYVSGASTIGERRGEVGAEDTEHRGYFLSPYERSKWESEQFVAEFVEKGVPAVMVNPSLVYGPGDSEHNGARLAAMLSGVITASVDAPAAYVFVDDVIRGIIAADEQGRPGERYILSGTNTTRVGFLQTAAAIAGVKPSLRAASPWQLKLFLWIERIRGKFSRRTPQLTRSAVETALHGAQYDSSKAVRELGLVFTELEEGLDQTIEWLYQEGKIDLPESVMPDGDSEPETAAGGPGETDAEGWEWVEVEDDELPSDDDEEWEWDEVEDEDGNLDADENEDESGAAASGKDDDGWEWVEVEEGGAAPEDDDEWEWEEVDDDDPEAGADPDPIGRNGNGTR